MLKLRGCCTETRVLLRVYEFIPNGSFYHHIDDSTEDFHVSWRTCLQINTKSAGALAYLHFLSSARIYHRDVKSSNMLLDEKYRAKLSIFGTSRVINIGKTQATTSV
uniref:Protein kinase domain-containing protein n=1 Tax=Opuntia streptacantha TaxID=393608 RepID=A0A7C8YF23_OPUST